MITTIPANSHPQLLDLIQETESIDAILSAGIDDNGVIFCLATEGDEQISVKIGDTIETRSFAQPTGDDAAGQFAAPEPDLVDEYVDRLATQDHFKPWLDRTKELLLQSSDLNEFSDKLDTLYPELSSVEFAEAMRNAMTAASLGGYFEASEDDGEVESSQDAEFSINEGINLLIDSIFDNYTLESIQLDAAASLAEFAKKIPEGTTRKDAD